jgi:hypothetical protein
MGGIRQFVLLEEAIRKICMTAQEALNAIDDKLWVVAQAKNGKEGVKRAEVWVNNFDVC